MSQFGASGTPESISAILLCGGKGTRLESITDGILPKSLVKVYGKELLRYSIDPIREEGRIQKIVFAVGHLAGMIHDWVRSLDLDIEVDFTEQDNPGVIGAIQAAVLRVPSDTYVICNTDEIRDGVALGDVIRHHHTHTLPATLLASLSNNLFRHRLLQINENGVIVGSQLKAPQFNDDNETYGYINTGLLCVDLPAFNHVDSVHFGNDWSALINPLHDKGLLAAHIQEGVRYYNVGTPIEFEEAETAMSETFIT